MNHILKEGYSEDGLSSYADSAYYSHNNSVSIQSSVTEVDNTSIGSLEKGEIFIWCLALYKQNNEIL